jgi:hypothetical protein
MALIKCPECNSDISDQAPACPKCGFPIKNADIQDASDNSTTSNKILKPKKKSRLKPLLLILICLVIVYYSLPLFIGHSSGTVSDVLRPKRDIPLLNGSIVVEAAGYKYYNFSINQNWRNISLTGSFQASGGSGNDIRVLVMTNNDFKNYTNGHKASSYYNSGKLTASNVNINLPSQADDYVLVFDNAFSLISDKTVTGNITLSYSFY